MTKTNIQVVHYLVTHSRWRSHRKSVVAICNGVIFFAQFSYLLATLPMFTRKWISRWRMRGVLWNNEWKFHLNFHSSYSINCYSCTTLYSFFSATISICGMCWHNWWIERRYEWEPPTSGNPHLNGDLNHMPATKTCISSIQLILTWNKTGKYPS